MESDWYGKVELAVVNGLGQRVYFSELQKYNEEVLLEIDLQDLPGSVYRLVISSEDVVASRAFVKL